MVIVDFVTTPAASMFDKKLMKKFFFLGVLYRLDTIVSHHADLEWSSLGDDDDYSQYITHSVREFISSKNCRAAVSLE